MGIILLVTGQLAKNLVEEQAKKCNKKCKVIALNFPVASLMRPSYIIRELKNYINEEIECIVLPGLIQGDLSKVENELKVKVVKGPKHAYDIPFILNNFDINELSKEVPADEIAKEKIKKIIDEEIAKVEAKEALPEEGNFMMRNLKYGVDFPIRIIAEIVDAPLLSEQELKKKAKYFIDSGADVIDIGMLANESKVEKIKEMIRILRESFDVPLSLDSMDLEEINKAIELNIDMVISLDRSLLKKVNVKDEVHYVLVPADLEQSYFPKEPKKRVELLLEMLEIAKERKIKNVILDVILDPPFSSSFSDSLYSYKILREKLPRIPILIGTGNITELIDADTAGMNALLMMFAYEINASFVLSTEASDKTRGVIKEIFIAKKIGFISRHKKTFPKGLGIDLLFLRDKKLKDERKEEENAEVIYANNINEFYIQDPKGWFKIYLDRDNKEIILHYKPSYRETKSKLIIKGKDPVAMYRKVAELGLISKIDHACYLGSELQKAYIALKLGKSYLQDAELFK